MGLVERQGKGGDQILRAAERRAGRGAHQDAGPVHHDSLDRINSRVVEDDARLPRGALPTGHANPNGIAKRAEVGPFAVQRVEGGQPKVDLLRPQGAPGVVEGLEDQGVHVAGRLSGGAARDGDSEEERGHGPDPHPSVWRAGHRHAMWFSTRYRIRWKRPSTPCSWVGSSAARRAISCTSSAASAMLSGCWKWPISDRMGGAG